MTRESLGHEREGGVLSDDERDALRHRALTAWHDAKRLATAARELADQAVRLGAEEHEQTAIWHALRLNLVRQRRVLRAVDDVLAAPETAIVLRTGDSDIDAHARRAGYATLARSVALVDILTAMEQLVAR